MGEPGVLTLVRHGQTQANLDAVWHGSTDTPLTELGRAQARRVADFLGERARGAAAVYASPLQRALHTAEAIAAVLGLEARREGDLTEFDLGRWEGLPYQTLFREHRLWEHMKRDRDFAPHGGESPRRVCERIAGALRRLAAAHAGERIVVVGHGGALAMGLALLLDGSYSEWRKVMDNCAVSELVLDPEPRLVSFNLIDHLAGL